jgi:hypothetical protein
MRDSRTSDPMMKRKWVKCDDETFWTLILWVDWESVGDISFELFEISLRTLASKSSPRQQLIRHSFLWSSKLWTLTSFFSLNWSVIQLRDESIENTTFPIKSRSKITQKVLLTDFVTLTGFCDHSANWQWLWSYLRSSNLSIWHWRSRFPFDGSCYFLSGSALKLRKSESLDLQSIVNLYSNPCCNSGGFHPSGCRSWWVTLRARDLRSLCQHELIQEFKMRIR